jgi:hypothetical protein
LLHTDIATARTEFMTVAPTDLEGRTPIGIFAGTSGEQLALVRSGTSGRTATLEEIVLGHLAGRRFQPGTEEAA